MLRVKRGHIDAFDSNEPIGLRCHPHGSNTLDGSDNFLPSSPFKKCKLESEDSNFQITKLKRKTLRKHKSNKNDELERWFSFLPKSRKNHHQSIGSLYSSSYGDSIFSLEDVKNIVCGALKEKEEEIRKEYDTTLIERLSDQWSTFAKYNEDFIHKPKDTSLSYMS